MEDLEADYESFLYELGLFMADSQPLYTSSHVNDADPADTQLGNHFPDETDWLNTSTPDPLLFNLDTLMPNTNTDIDYALHPNWWDLDAMLTLTESSPSATLNSSSVSVQSPDFSPAYSTSSLSTNYSPREQLLPPTPTLGPTPTPAHDSSSKKKLQQRRRSKAERGNRPCDKKREQRKFHKKVECELCLKLVQDPRDLERHYKAKHPKEAADKGIDMSKIPCEYCEEKFARKDHLKRHEKNQHGIE
ncbi:hypothetical protein N0V84_000412 [Fusarium piperis]|uniref:C2H2-type domain-containing protein n=1 Tax=Fusarium piperis TaxID=1435070 RepID=A0A9W9BV62_9HYPO|nr:hypothetical protein N0V84_000412 [Fusarium piperis]